MRSNFRKSAIGLLAISSIVLGAVAANSTSVKKMSVADLTGLGARIVVGDVVSISDGFDSNNLPYTDVTVNVYNSIKGGNVNGYYTFRQFGLAEPRDMGDGTTYVGISPDGFPRFKDGQKVMLFLFETTSLGFQSTVGLLQGKFLIKNGQLRNDINNEGLFAGINVDPGQLTDEEQKLVQVERGPVRADTFIGFIDKAVKNNWFTE